MKYIVYNFLLDKEIKEIEVDLFPTKEIRKPKQGEYYFCSHCNKVEMCHYPECCPDGEIYILFPEKSDRRMICAACGHEREIECIRTGFTQYLKCNYCGYLGICTREEWDEKVSIAMGKIEQLINQYRNVCRKNPEIENEIDDFARALETLRYVVEK
jgi:hypothetical protein